MGQPEVHEEHIRTVFADQGQGSASVSGLGDDLAPGQGGSDGASRHGGVVHDQDADRSWHPVVIGTARSGREAEGGAFLAQGAEDPGDEVGAVGRQLGCRRCGAGLVREVPVPRQDLE